MELDEEGDGIRTELGVKIETNKDKYFPWGDRRCRRPQRWAEGRTPLPFSSHDACTRLRRSVPSGPDW